MASGAKILMTSAFAVLAAGCATLDAEDALAGIDAPESWSAVSADLAEAPDAITSDWLADLNDPAVTTLVAEAIARNNDLAASAARVQATRERVGLTRSSLLPALGGSLGGATSKTPSRAILDETTNQVINVPASTSENFNLGFSLSWELDIWGRLTDQTRSAYIGAEAARLDLASTQLSIAGATAQSYYALTEARLQRQLSERDVDTGKANLRIIERRYDRGVSSSLDVRLARSSLASSESTLIARQQAELEAARRLEVLLGRYPSAAIEAAETLPDLADFWSETTAAIGTPATALFSRPDLIAAERRLKASGLDARAARKALLPSLSLSGSAVQQTTKFGDIAFDWTNSGRNLTANLFQPLFQGGRLRAQARAAQNDLEATAFSYAQTVLTAYQEAEDALAAERFLTAQLDQLRLAFDEAAAAESLTERQYLNGTSNIFNLINAQQRRISAESQFINAARQRLSNRINLYLALGAPFELPESKRLAAMPEGAPS